ncbi:MAG: exosortase A [Rhodospirillaceae bacterium]
MLVIYDSTVASALYQWRTSSAYSHGWLIAPIALYIAWHDRARLRGLAPTPTFAGLAIIAAFACVWLAADFMSIDEGRHIALVGMIQGLLLATLGWRIARILMFPIMYLWLMVPTGTFLLAPLQHLSHAGAAWMLRATGIPTFTDGMLIEVPEGSFMVETGCAGLNFLLTALALSLVFAKVSYDGLLARILCVAVALATSILANITRIYLIIVITQFTHRKLDIASDHLVYGWCFFGIIMVAMMSLGTRLARSRPAPAFAAAPPRAPGSFGRPAFAAAAAVCLAAAAPVLAAATSNAHRPEQNIDLPDSIGSWRKVDAAAGDWRPEITPGSAFIRAAYVDHGRRVDLAVVSYGIQSEGQEAASAANRPAKAEDILSEATQRISLLDAPVTVWATQVVYRGAARSVLSWYESAGCRTVSRLRAKLCAAGRRARGLPFPGAYVALSIGREAGDGTADSALADFAKALMERGPVLTAGAD